MPTFNFVGVNAKMVDPVWTMDMHGDGNTPSSYTRASVTIVDGTTEVYINFAGLVMGDATLDPLLQADLENQVEGFMNSFQI